MAIFPKDNFHEPAPAPAQSVDIEAWTERATEALSTVTISAPSTLRGTTSYLAIPLDEHRAPETQRATEATARDSDYASSSQPRREPIRRDSLKRREALLKGKEGSRQRRRWENGW